MKRTNADLKEEAPAAHKALQALTRRGRPSISVVCLHRYNGQLNTQPDGTGLTVDLAQKPSGDLTQVLVEATVGVSHQGVFWHLLPNVSAPAGWRNHALLKNYRALVFENGVCRLEGSDYTLHLTQSLGLIIEKEAS
jgi:hypothetical protein